MPEQPNVKKTAGKRLRDILAKSYSDAWEAKARGEKIGWCTSAFPQEIPTAMGVKVVYPENQAAAIAARGAGQPMCEHAEGMGYSNDICAYARVSLAYADLKGCAAQDMSQPDFIMCCNNICNVVIKWYESLASELRIPMILIDTPFSNGSEVSEDRIAYIRAQFDDAIRQMEEITGKTFSEEKLKEVIAISQRSSAAWLKANTYCQYTPSPLNGFDMFNHMAVAVCARGTIEAAEAYEQLVEEYEEMIKSGASTYNGDQRFRIMFEGIPCWPHVNHTYTVLKNYEIISTETIYARVFAFIYESMDGLARAYCSVPNNLSFETNDAARLEMCRNNHVDGAILHTNRSCKMMCGLIPEMERHLRENLGIPVITFDGDQADPRNFAKAQYDTRIQGLFEVMTANKAKEKK